MPRYFNIDTALSGSTPVTTIQSISITEKATRIVASGDADKSPTFMAKGMLDVEMSITMQDGLSAQTLMQSPQADFTFKGDTGVAGTRKLVTVKGFQAFSRSTREGHDKVAEVVITGYGFDSTGAGAIFTEATST